MQLNFQSAVRIPMKSITVSERKDQATIFTLLWFAAFTGISILASVLMVVRSPTGSIYAWVVYFIGLAIILYRPRYGIYLVVGLGLAGDTILSPWFPFVKNFSSPESLLFIHNSVIISPLESYLVAIFLSWLIRSIALRQLKIVTGELTLPAVIFIAFTLFGLFYGISTGGNVNIALWEARPIFYLVAMLLLTSQLLKRREHMGHVLWAAMAGIFFEAITGNVYYWTKVRGHLSAVNSITDHSAAIHMNLLFVFLLAGLLYKISPRARSALLLILPVVLIPYIATQRRAAYLTLGIALIFLAIMLFKHNRKGFWLIVPPVMIILVAYLGVFWNRSTSLAIPAQAVKTIIAPHQANARDQASNAYRDAENYNLQFTIRQKPITGIGFGQKFYIVIPMADISFFQWWQYFPHNSIIWIWLKTGVGGFLSMLYLIGLALMVGGRALRRIPPGPVNAPILAAVLFLVMQFMFAYVDIGWDTQSMVLTGALMGILNTAEQIVARPVPLPKKRWRWQRDPEPEPGLIPLTGSDGPLL